MIPRGTVDPITGIYTQKSPNGDIFTFDPATHTYTLNARPLPSITQVLKATGWVNEEFYTEEGRRRGQAVHRACWYLAEGDLEEGTVKPAYKPFVDGFAKFLTEKQPKIMFCELPLYSKRFMFAGTPDIFCSMQGRPSVPDIKTGDVGLSAAIQTAAQGLLIEENFGIKGIDRYALQLPGDGTYKLQPFTDRQDEPMFINALAMVHRRKNGK